MSIFDRWFRRGSAGLKERAAIAGGSFRAPAGFAVAAWAGEIDVPSFSRMDGGVWLASTGRATDVALETLRALLVSVDEALSRPPLIAHLARPEARVAELCTLE